MAELLAPHAYSRGVPHELFDALRAKDPVLWWEEPAGSAWLVTGYAELQEINRDPGHFSNWVGGIALTSVDDATLVYLRTNLLGMDPPAHTKLRRVVSRGFTPRFVGRLEA